MKKKKSLIVEHYFFGENSSQLDVFWPRPGLQTNHGTIRKSAIFPQPRLNQDLTLCERDSNFNAQSVKIPHFKRPLTCEQAR